jgi:hypothetical protein
MLMKLILLKVFNIFTQTRTLLFVAGGVDFTPSCPAYQAAHPCSGS